MIAALGRNRSAMGLSDVRAHDLRRTFATLPGSCGMNDFEIGLVLNHVSARSQITGRIYNHAGYLPEKRKVLQAVEGKVLEILAAAKGLPFIGASQDAA